MGEGAEGKMKCLNEIWRLEKRNLSTAYKYPYRKRKHKLNLHMSHSLRWELMENSAHAFCSQNKVDLIWSGNGSLITHCITTEDIHLFVYFLYPLLLISLNTPTPFRVIMFRYWQHIITSVGVAVHWLICFCWKHESRSIILHVSFLCYVS